MPHLHTNDLLQPATEDIPASDSIHLAMMTGGYACDPSWGDQIFGGNHRFSNLIAEGTFILV